MRWTMKIRMLKTMRGSPNGVDIFVYREGEEYDLSRDARALDLANVFLREGWAESAEKPAPKPVEDKKTPPENKNLASAPENKGKGR
jgi:hypothetical protein